MESKTVLFVTHDPSETILLSDRILIFSARPGRIATDCAVPFERPRGELSETMKLPEYRELYDELLHQLMSSGGH